MISGLKPYTEYINSGFLWIGKIPKTWELKRLGSILTERGEKNSRNEISDVLSVMKDRGVIPYSEKGRVGNKRSDDIRRYKIVRPDDIVVNCMNVIIGSVGMSKYTGCLSPVYYVLRKRNDNDYAPYFEYFFKNKIFQKSLVRIGNGILSHRMRIPMELLKCEMITRPSFEEQKIIVKFLDYITSKIDKAISLKRKTISLLKEQKQSIIHRAVTRGLDPNVKMKESGIPWIGKVPEQWEVRRLKNTVKINPSKSESKHVISNDTEVTFLPMEKVGIDGRIITDTICKIEKVKTGFTYFRRNDILVAKITPCFENGKGAYLSELPTEIGFGSTEFHVLRANEMILPEYLFLLTGLHAFRDSGTKSMTGSAGQQRVPINFISNFQIGIPSKEQQRKIIDFVDSAQNDYEKKAGSLKKEINLLMELKTKIISDAVTGKVNISDAYLNTNEKQESADDNVNSENIDEEEAAQ